MAQATVTIQLALKGLDQLGALRKQIDQISNSGASKAFDGASRSTAQYAAALARLQQVQGDNAAAINTLTTALTKLDQESLAAIRLQTQLAYLQTQYANSPLISAIRDQSGAFGNLGDSATSAGEGLANAAAGADK